MSFSGMTKRVKKKKRERSMYLIYIYNLFYNFPKRFVKLISVTATLAFCLKLNIRS